MNDFKHKLICYECNVFLVKLEQQSLASRLSPTLIGHVTQLRSNLGLLMDAWSEMARRNIANDILRILVAMEAEVAPSDKIELVKVKNLIINTLRTQAVTNARYKSVLCLGYRVRTAGSAYSGLVDDWADMKARCDNMKVAIQNAYGLAAPYDDPSKKVLKIFMAPEFYFRGRNGAYDFDVVMGIGERRGDGSVGTAPGHEGIMELLCQEIGKDIYKNWLFVLGTVVAATKETRTKCTQCDSELDFIVDKTTGKTKPVCKRDITHVVKEDVVGARVDNIALIYKEGQFYSVSKELVSHVDFVSDKVELRGEDLDVIKRNIRSNVNAASDRPAKFSDERMGGSIFTVDGVTFGLEVCLDHVASVKGDTGRLDHAANIQVQLIPSAGMSITQFRALPKGIVFNVDGTLPQVQVVGPNGNKLEAHFDSAFDGQFSMDDFKISKDMNKFQWPDDPNDDAEWALLFSQWTPNPAPDMVGAPDGSVLMYGPYVLP